MLVSLLSKLSKKAVIGFFVFSVPLAMQAGKISQQKLIEAVKSKDLEKVQELIKNGEDVNQFSYQYGGEGVNPLLQAIIDNNQEIVECLIKNGAQVDKANNNNETALIFAARKGLDKLVLYLLECGANPNTLTKGDSTPLMEAASSGCEQAAEYILKFGGKWNRSTFSVNDYRRVIFSSDKNSIDDAILSNVMLSNHARYGNNLEEIKKYVDNGANVNVCDALGDTPVVNAVKNDRSEIVEFLLLNGAEVDFIDKEGNTPLMYAVVRNQIDIVRLLIAHKTNVNYISKQESTPLVVAINNNYKEIAQLLIKNGALIDLVTNERTGINHLINVLLNIGDGSALDKLFAYKIKVDHQLTAGATFYLDSIKFPLLTDSTALHTAVMVLNQLLLEQKKAEKLSKEEKEIINNRVATARLNIEKFLWFKPNKKLMDGGSRTAIDISTSDEVKNLISDDYSFRSKRKYQDIFNRLVCKSVNNSSHLVPFDDKADEEDKMLVKRITHFGDTDLNFIYRQ